MASGASETPNYEDDAQQAARAGDALAMLEALWRSDFLAGLRRKLQADWPSFDHDDVDWVIGVSVDALFEDVRKGRTKRDIFPYLVKIARYKAIALHSEKSEEVPLNEDTVLYDRAPSLTDNERERFDTAAAIHRQEVYGTIRQLVQRIAQDRPRQVIGYIVDALEKRVHDVTNQEIADALGLSLDTVKVAKHRGFARLEDLAKEVGMVSFTFTIADFELQDEAAATEAAELEGDL